MLEMQQYGQEMFDNILENLKNPLPSGNGLPFEKIIEMVDSGTGGIPMLNTLKSALNYFHQRKIIVFLQGVKGLGENTNFSSKFDTDQQKQEFGLRVLMILEQVIDLQKAVIIAKLCKALGAEFISKSDFYVLLDCVHRLFVSDLESLERIMVEEKPDQFFQRQWGSEEDILLSGYRLHNAGLMQVGNAGVFGGGLNLKINKYGKSLLEIIKNF